MSEIDWLKLENRLRATPLNLLEQGLRRRQWEAISLAYTMLTGEKIELAPAPKMTYQEAEPVEIVTANDIGKQEEEQPLDDAPSPAYTEPEPIELEEPELDDDEDEDEDERPRKTNRIPTRSMSILVKNRKNKFTDNGIEATADLKFNPAQIREGANQPVYRKVKVRCAVCSKKEAVDPMLAPKQLDRNYTTRYVCNSCCSRGAS